MIAPNPNPWTVALDGGTTHTRAHLLLGDRVVTTARRAVGVRDAVADDAASVLVGAVRDCLDEVCHRTGAGRPDRIVAAGMLSSEVGLAAVPHVVAPAGLDDLARGMVVRVLPEVADGPIAFIPGVRTPAAPGPDGWAQADVLRGEECQTLGAWLTLVRPSGAQAPLTAVFLWVGSHTKLIEVDRQGRIIRSYTTLAGELTAAVAGHTLLTASLPEPWPAALDPEALAAGARLAGREGLGRAAFLVRIADLTGTWGPRQRAAFWIGAVVADDASCLARHPILATAVPVWVGGSPPRPSLYASALAARHGGPVTAIDEELAEHASALGALAIARHRDALDRRGGDRR